MRKFKKIYIEITNICNLNCDFCPETKRKPEIMNIETFCKILEQIKAHTEYIYFHVKGEPLLHPEIDKFLDISYKKGFKVNITTNGTLINEVKEKIIMKPALRQINFSLHSFGGEEGKESKDNEDNEDNEDSKDRTKYISDILAFTKEATRKSNLLVSLRLWNLEENNIINLEKQKNRRMLSIIENEFNLNCKIEEKVLPGRGIKISDSIYLNQDHLFKWPDLNENEDNDSGFCYSLRNQAAILVDGTVVPCCLDGNGIINLGNINTENFSKIIDNKRAKDILEGFSRREAVEELCRKCGYRKRFGTTRFT